jgi:formylglycine-generating enzyme required for sulfatase activity
MLIASGVVTGKEQLVSRSVTATHSRWTINRLPVCWENPRDEDENKRKLVREAIRGTWEKYSSLETYGWEGCATGQVAIRIFVGDTEWPRAFLGKSALKATTSMYLNFNPDRYEPFKACRHDVGRCLQRSAIHEFGHVLGFIHEQNRPDNTAECEMSLRTDQISLEQRSWTDLELLTSYDSESVMNYCFHSKRLDPLWLSEKDIAGIQMLFGVPKKESSPSEKGQVISAGSIYRDCPDCPEMVVLPAGSYQMGSEENDNEKPVHMVSIGKSFAVGKYEVSVGEFRAFVRATGYRTDAETNSGGMNGCRVFDSTANNWSYQIDTHWERLNYAQSPRHPVSCISWNDAKAYVSWLSKVTGRTYRLLSESEWEYAARAGGSTTRPWGDNANEACRYDNVLDLSKWPNGGVSKERHECNDGNFFPAPVGSYAANAFGLYDMIGNVGEWTEDCSNGSYKDLPSDGEAAFGYCKSRMVRGGSWLSTPTNARSARRFSLSTTSRFDHIGFRIATSLLPPKSLPPVSQSQTVAL